MAGVDAAYGTVAHGVAAAWLTAVRDEGAKKAEHVPKRFLDWETTQDGHAITCDANMLMHIRRYIDWCHEVEIEGDVFIEQRVGYARYTPIPNQGGTADHFVCVSPVIDQFGNTIEHGRLIITDLKMGVGIWVDVVRNTQAMLYALGVLLEWDWAYSFQKITIRICQPRLDYFGVWECTREDLMLFAEEVQYKADQGWRLDAPRTPSPKACQWCDDVDCVARSALLEDLGDDLFDDDAIAEADGSPVYTTKELDDHAMTPLFGKLQPDAEPHFHKRMSVAVMAWRYSHRKMFEKYFRDIGAELLRLVQAGQHVPGWKGGDGRRSFDWIDEDDAAMEMSLAGIPESKIYRTEVTSVSEAKKLYRETGLAPKDIEIVLFGTPKKPGLVKTTPGKTTLVPSGDPRIDVEDATDDAFDDDDEL